MAPRLTATAARGQAGRGEETAVSEQEPGPAGPTVAELDESLLDAKLLIPHPHPGSVSRAEVI